MMAPGHRRHPVPPAALRALRVLLQLLLLIAGTSAGGAADFDYRLEPRRIADGVYVLTGLSEDFSFANGGNIVNTGFVVGTSGVVVIDSGPSKRYGEQMRAAIARVTSLPVALVINTHHHPDHFLGNQAFAAGTLAALSATTGAIETEGPAFLDNMYRLNGDWMRDTEVVVPRRALAPGLIDAGGRELELIVLAGHTAADLAVLDRASGTLFAADLVFNGRAPTTPHADIAQWLQALDRLDGIAFRQIVPGHGEVATDSAPIAQTRRYLQWLAQTVDSGAEHGLDMTEMLTLPIPPAHAGLAVVAAEYRRSVTHLYPEAEQAALRSAGRP